MAYNSTVFNYGNCKWVGHFVRGELQEQGWEVGFKPFWQKLSIDDCIVGTGDEQDAEKKS